MKLHLGVIGNRAVEIGFEVCEAKTFRLQVTAILKILVCKLKNSVHPNERFTPLYTQEQGLVGLPLLAIGRKNEIFRKIE